MPEFGEIKHIEQAADASSTESTPRMDIGIAGARSQDTLEVVQAVSDSNSIHGLEQPPHDNYPIQRIPPELLEEIFLCCIADQDFVQLEPALNSPPLVIASVCSRWRNLALGTPSLWCSLSITISSNTSIAIESLIDAWIQRTSSSALSFSITKSDGLDKSVSVASVLRRFVPHYPRWKRVRLEYSDWRSDSGLMVLPDNALYASLEEISLNRGWWTEESDIELISGILHSAPRLRNLTWNSQKGFTYLHCPWGQMTSVSLGHLVLLDEAISILEMCPNLSYASLAIHSRATPGSTLRIPVQHRCIRSLDLLVQGGMGHLFQQLELPSLTNLKLRTGNSDYNMYWPNTAFRSFILRSGCHLQALEFIDSLYLSPHDIIDFLKLNSSSLRTLVISNTNSKHICVTDEVFNYLTLPHDTFASNKHAGGDCACPNLSWLIFRSCIISSCTDRAITDMLESRSNPPATFARLERVVIEVLSRNGRRLFGSRDRINQVGHHSELCI
ncbi:hypothetical protein BD779DRAFT_586597 [Infundibulicybe gibba]|nr:hypothetical protein BD779DRAFT_586597 [Infundibulicybe gibba]